MFDTFVNGFVHCVDRLIHISEEVELGPYAEMAKYAGYTFAACFALKAFLGRFEKEPAKSEVPKTSQQFAVALGALCLVLMLVFLQDPASKVPLAWIATLSSLILALSGLIFIYCTNFHVFRAPDMPKGSGWTYQGIVGSTSPKVLTDSAKKSLKTQTIEKVLAGCVHDWGSVFDDNWRQRMQFTFLLIYFFLYLSAIVAFGSIGQLLVVSKSKEPAGEHAGGEQHMAPDNPTH